MELWEVTVTDLWRDECGYSANCCWVNRYRVKVREGVSDKALARKLKAAAGIQGMRSDNWCGADFAWRNGLIGAWADYIGKESEVAQTE